MRRAPARPRRARSGRAAPALLAGLLALGVAALLVALRARSGDAGPAGPGWQRSSRASQLALLPLGPEDLVFLGASLVEHGEWSELLPGRSVRNRGIAGDKVGDVLARLAPIVAAGPRAVFVMVGLNDVFAGTPPARIEQLHRELVQRLRAGAPATRVVLMTLLPVRRPGAEGRAVNATIDEVNAGLARVADEAGCLLLDLTPAFRDEDGQLRAGFTRDGVHLNGPGYQAWRRVLEDCACL